MKWAKATLFGLILFCRCIDLTAEEDSERIRFLRNIRIAAGETAADAICFNCSIIILGQLGGDAVAIGGDIVVQGTLRGDAVALGGNIHALPNSRTDADLIALCGAVRADPGASVSGDVESFPYFHVPGQRSFHPLGTLIFCVVNVGILLVLGYSIGARRCENLAGAVRRHPWMVALAGLLVLTLCLLMVVLGDLVPRFGEILIMLLTLVLLVTGAYGYTGEAWLVGQRLAKGRTRLVTWLAATLVLTVLFLIPVLGFAAMLSGLVLALGSVTLTRFGADAEGSAGRLLRLARSRPRIDVS